MIGEAMTEKTEKLYYIIRSLTSKPGSVATPSKAAITSLSVKLWHFYVITDATHIPAPLFFYNILLL